jgi:dTDP-4-amino-4,6-dideoxygalactose transaminase
MHVFIDSKIANLMIIPIRIGSAIHVTSLAIVFSNVIGVLAKNQKIESFANG